MKRIFSIVLLGFVMTVFSGCGSTDEKTQEQEQQENLKKISFELQTPDDWETLPDDQYPSHVLLIKREPSFSNEVSTLISVAAEQGVYHSLVKFAERNLESIRKNSQDFRLISREEFTLLSGQEAFFVEYSDWYSRSQKRIHFYDLYVFDRENNKSYSVSLIFDPKTSDNHKEFLEKVIKTFSLTPVSAEE